MARLIPFSVLVVSAMLLGTGQAAIYKYTDEHGQVHYSNEKPAHKQYNQVPIESSNPKQKNSKTKDVKIPSLKDVDQALREGKITETIATRIRYFHEVSDEFSELKKKKEDMKKTISLAKKNQANMTAEELAQLEKDYEDFVKEEFFYAQRNYAVAKQQLQNLLNSQNNKSTPSSNKKESASINWD